ncbi:MAG: CAP domain-containing protein [Candidatus Dormibacteria bacterium]
MERRSVPSPWEELLRTASAVRATPSPTIGRSRGGLPRAIRPIAMTAGLLAAAGLAVLHLAGTSGVASANGSLDSQLFSLTNQDRTSNGVRSLTFSGTLQNIGEGAPYNCRGVQVYGRSDDMIRRNYFAHPILGCGEYVFSMMQAFGIHYQSAGENIGWESGSGSPASYINSAFMGSSDHRSNILDGSYTEMGVGSDESAPGVYWTGVGSVQNVWMFSEEFAQAGSSSPPPPHRSPTPKPAKRNSPAPPAPGVAGASTTPASTAPAPTATPLLIPAGSLPESLSAPPVGQYEGLFPNTIESVLEAFLSL